MNLHLYKVLDMREYRNCDDLEKTQVMTEKGLREEFLRAYNNGEIPQDLLYDYQQSNDYKNENWNDMGNLRVGTMIDMMNDICNYNCGKCYYILETDVDVQLDKKMLDRWLDVLNYWADHIQDLGERYDDLHPMYVKYEKIIDEIYKLTK